MKASANAADEVWDTDTDFSYDRDIQYGIFYWNGLISGIIKAM